MEHIDIGNSGDILNRDNNLNLTWTDVSVWCKKKRQTPFWRKQEFDYIQVLKNVCGIAKSGNLLAIMGASGAGKTTLLATISLRIKGEVNGKILINGKSLDKECMAHIAGFVPQKDLTINSLTVHEHMEFMACLKMDQSATKTERQRNISLLLCELGLTKCQNSRLSSLSGGEEKRLSLAVQLLTDPPLLFCDEPTSGLDSFSAAAVLEKLSGLAARGKAVVCSVHQPASGLFDAFSHVVLLAGGRLAYFGTAAGAARHFDSLNLICPRTYNKAEFYISQLSIISGREEESKNKIKQICDEFETSVFAYELAEQLVRFNRKTSIFQLFTDDVTQSNQLSTKDKVEENVQRFIRIGKAGCVKQLYWLSRREAIQMIRNSSDIFLRATLYMLVALLLATPYVDLKVDQTGIQNIQGLMFLIITETVFTFAYSVFHTFPNEIPILLREIANGLYTPGTYYLAKIAVQMPRTIIESLLYCTLIFWIADLGGGFQVFLVFCVPVIICAISATAYGCVLSAAFESVSTASLLAVPIDFIGLSYSGIYISLRSLPSSLSWICYLSQFYYGTEAVSILQWQHINHIPCAQDPDVPCISTGREVLHKYGYGPNNFFLDLLGLISIYIVSHIVGFLAICYRSKQKSIY